MEKLDAFSTEQHLLSGGKIIDVRAPVEFAEGSLPNSVNLPILDDSERAMVGTCYKKQGQESAIALGHELVSGKNKEQKILGWKNFIEKNPGAILTCFRGGLRSRTAQRFLSETGIEISRIENGYKGMRAHLTRAVTQYSQEKTFRALTGNTGSGKTRLLWEIAKIYPAVDLEDLACHRGSAFGRLPNKPQPAQGSFENGLACEILKYDRTQNTKPILFEDESRVIGSLHLPEVFFDKLRASSVIKLKVTLEKRIQNIYEDYILIDEIENLQARDVLFDRYIAAIKRIEKKLGGLRSAEILDDMKNGREQLEINRQWIEKLLVWYYDPLYTYSLGQRNPTVEFEGTEVEVLSYLKSTR